ncbi:hypothetical protein EST38_g4318 [Candolleomyces aberdarensis]|uniref:Tim44-like domain-containing protein n=1 Tax=Candolleomyces aberdarensis TaxID=2316362 RepID=A0A4Q2DRJ1_9AGAR|nr:hypothetical protein EST38_g4318 [Candolleomyces aberdarensis]
MAMNVSRACGLRLRLSAMGTPAYSAGTQSWRVVSRSYATESAVISKRRGAPSAKATHKSTNVSSASPKKVSVKVEERAAGHAGKDAVADLRALPGSSKTKKNAGVANAAQSSSQAAPPKKLSVEEQQLQELEAIEYFKKIMKSADPFGQPIVASLGAQTNSLYGSVKEWWSQRLGNLLNGAKNMMSMLYLAGDNAIPGVNLGRVPWYKSFGWIFKAWRVKSTKDNTWIAPLRQIALDTYRDLNQMVASGNVKGVKALTAAEYQAELLRRVKKQPSNLTFKWNLEGVVSPIQIVSLRVAQYHMGKEDPKFGSRYLVHALVKLDTEQSLECYGPRGEPLHEVPAEAVKRPNGTIAAKPKRVTEYLVLEKRLWYDSPWVFREQKWDVPQRK